MPTLCNIVASDKIDKNGNRVKNRSKVDKCGVTIIEQSSICSAHDSIISSKSSFRSLMKSGSESPPQRLISISFVSGMMPKSRSGRVNIVLNSKIIKVL